MAPKITNSIRAVYTPDDIRALIVADMRARGFTEIVSEDVQTPDYFVGPSGKSLTMVFEGYEIRKDIPTKEKPPAHRYQDRA